MNSKSIYVGDCKILNEEVEVKGATVVIDGETYYKISNNNAMRPFFYECCKRF